MNAEHRALIALSAALAARDPEGLEGALDGAAAAADGEAAEEVLLQSYLFLGYPVALNALARWREVSGRDPGPPSHDRAGWQDRGRRVCSAVYGGQYDGLRANVRRLHPDMERWMVEEGYGKVLGRPGLPLVDRELCIVALLAVLDVPRQLHSHLRGALNVGASVEAVEETLEVAEGYSEAAAAERARRTWETVRARWLEKEGG